MLVGDVREESVVKMRTLSLFSHFWSTANFPSKTPLTIYGTYSVFTAVEADGGGGVLFASIKSALRKYGAVLR